MFLHKKYFQVIIMDKVHVIKNYHIRYLILLHYKLSSGLKWLDLYTSSVNMEKVFNGDLLGFSPP